MLPYYENQTERIRIELTELNSFPEHLHTQAEMVYLFRGRMTLRVDGQQVVLEPGDLCLCFPSIVHSYVQSQDAQALLMIFPPDLCPAFKNTLTRSKPTLPHVERAGLTEDIPYCMQMLAREAAQTHDEHVLVAYLQVVLARVLPRMPLREAAAATPDTLRRLLMYLSEHFQEPIHLQLLSRTLGVSPSFLSRTLARALGMNLCTYLNTLRLNYACTLLAASDLPITQIAYESGFTSLRTFNRFFRLSYGMTPTQHRELRRPAQ